MAKSDQQGETSSHSQVLSSPLTLHVQKWLPGELQTSSITQVSSFTSFFPTVFWAN